MSRILTLPPQSASKSVSASLGEPIAIAKGVVGASRREITLTIYESRIRDDNGLREEGNPAVLTIAGSKEDPAQSLDGMLRGMGERRSIVLSVRNRSLEQAGGHKEWADVFRGKWNDDRDEIIGTFLPINAASRIGAMYRGANRIREAEAFDRAKREIETETKKYGQIVRMWPDRGLVHFKLARPDASERTAPRRGPGM